MVNGGLYNWIYIYIVTYSVHKRTQKRVAPPCDMNSFNVLVLCSSRQVVGERRAMDGLFWLSYDPLVLVCSCIVFV